MRASGDPKYLTDGPWGQMVAMLDATFHSLASGNSWSGDERNHLFLGVPSKNQFQAVSGVSGADDPGDSRAFATLDFDRDGWVDMALGNVGYPRFRLLHNRVGERVEGAERSFVALRFVGGNDEPRPSKEWSSRDALGARVELDLDDGKGGVRTIHREHRRDDGFKAQHTATMLVGIDAATTVPSIRVRWPSGRTQTIADVAAGTLLTLHENAAQSPTGESVVRESYAPDASDAEPEVTRLHLGSAHGATGLTLVTTMSTTCAACARALPEVAALRAAFGDDELTLLGVPVGDESAEALRSYEAGRSPAYRLVTDLTPAETGRVREAVVSRLHADGGTTPATFVTDASGRILTAAWGMPTISELKKLGAGAGSR